MTDARAAFDLSPAHSGPEPLGVLLMAEVPRTRVAAQRAMDGSAAARTCVNAVGDGGPGRARDAASTSRPRRRTRSHGWQGASLRHAAQPEDREAAVAGNEAHGENAAGARALRSSRATGVDLVRRALR